MTTPPLALEAPAGVLINGEWGPTAESRSYDVVCPATGDVVASVAQATAADADRAVRAAHEAFPAWSKTTTEQRYDALMALADRIDAARERLTIIEVVDTGSTISRMRNDVVASARLLRMYAGMTRELRGSTIPVGPGMLAYTQRQPFGPVAHIIPFNHPLMFAAQAIGGALAAGNTIVLKPSEHTPLTTRELAELARDLFPSGVINLLTGFGPEVGQPVVEHPFVRKVFFRGSVPTGRLVATSCAARGVPFEMELGGKNPFIVFPDADLASAAKGAVAGLNLGHQGQSCGSATRLMVHDDVYDDFKVAILEAFSKIRVGLPWDPEVEMGAVVSSSQYERVLGYMRQAEGPGSRLLLGGGPHEDPSLEGGFFLQPTVVEVDDPAIPIASEEIFGPVTSLLRWSSEADVVALANSLDYGLTSSVWTNALSTAHRVATMLEAGMVWVNQHGPRPTGVPIGGWKASGSGKELAFEEMDGYTHEKTVLVKVDADAG